MENVKEFVKDCLEREYDLPADVDFDTFDFIKTGYIDSIGYIQFISMLEDEYDITFDSEELDDEENQIAGNLVKLVERKIKEKNNG